MGGRPWVLFSCKLDTLATLSPSSASNSSCKSCGYTAAESGPWRCHSTPDTLDPLLGKSWSSAWAFFVKANPLLLVLTCWLWCGAVTAWLQRSWPHQLPVYCSWQEVANAHGFPVLFGCNISPAAVRKNTASGKAGKQEIKLVGTWLQVRNAIFQDVKWHANAQGYCLLNIFWALLRY